MTLLQEYSIILLSHIFTAVFLISKIDCMRQNVGKTHRYRSSGNNAVVDNMGIPLCPDIPARYAFLKPNTKVGDIISGAPPSAAGFPSLYYIKDGNEHRLFSIDKNSGKVYVATPISLPLLMMNHKLTIIVSSGLKTCSLKIFIQAAAFKQGSERSFLVPSPRVDLMDKLPNKTPSIRNPGSSSCPVSPMIHATECRWRAISAHLIPLRNNKMSSPIQPSTSLRIHKML
ncbi:uncharacterized protein LOC129587857 [Paramacrobiotus metropolitanus]|uniref:uncharacterized protein LOC129587857 n=1 Tax=Paramacrobiotus metropolitanus TaxID=2943436 RepID=UPI002445E96D|nr:uncharacterized protein LOC129587857 [Paramacrobiotus metropolitanus]